MKLSCAGKSASVRWKDEIALAPPERIMTKCWTKDRIPRSPCPVFVRLGRSSVK